MNTLLFSYAGLNELIVILGAGLLAAGFTFTANWFSLIPWRRSRNQHWTEQARLVFPVMTAARSNLWVIPSILALAVVLIWPDSSPLWFFTGIAGALGAYAGTIPLHREVYPHIFTRGWQRTIIISMLLRFLVWFIFIGAAVWMPGEFSFLTLWIGGAVTCLWLFWLWGGAFWMGIKLGIYIPAPERLQKIADATSLRMQIPFREVILIKSRTSQAVAYLHTRRLGFTKRLLEIAPDDEIAAICAHELAHLTESKAVYYSRYIQMLAILP